MESTGFDPAAIFMGIANGIPSGLLGEVGSDRIDLKINRKIFRKNNSNQPQGPKQGRPSHWDPTGTDDSGHKGSNRLETRRTVDEQQYRRIWRRENAN